MRLFTVFNFTWMGKHVVKTLEAFEDIPAAWLQETTCMKNCVADQGEVFTWFFRSANARAQIQTDGADTVDKDLKILLLKICCFPIGQSALCKYGRYIFTDQLYLAVCTMIVATVWAVYSGFCILDLPKHHLLYVCDSFCLFLSVLTSNPLPPPPPRSRLQREVNSRSVFYQGTFTLNLQDTTPGGCRWSLTGLQTETSQQNGRPEWPNCTLNLNPLVSFCTFFMCYVPLCFLLTCMLFLFFFMCI